MKLPPSAADTHLAYAFDAFRVEVRRRVLLHQGEAVPLTPKVFATLLELVRFAGQVVGKDQLMQAVWPDTIVDENNLNQNIVVLRRALRDRRGTNQYIQTVPGVGYRFVGDVRETGSSPAAIQYFDRIAVLPFDHVGGEDDRAYLADGLTEETIVALGQIDPARIGVLSRTSVQSYRNRTESLRGIGRELGATYLVEGSLRGENERLRVTARLVRAGDQVQLWSAAFDGEPRSILEFQRELAAAIARQVQLHLAPGRLDALAHRHSTNADAFDAYLRGRHCWHQLTPPTTRRALELFASATRIDPDYALAWSGIVDALCVRPVTGDTAPLDVLPAATHAIGHALRAQPDVAEVQASLGFRKFWLAWDWPGAEAAFRRAIELDPNYPLPYRMLGLLYSHLRRSHDALSSFRHARELDPLLPVHHALSAQAAFAVREFELAAQFARQALVIDPDFWVGHWQLAQACVELGDLQQANQALAEANRTSGGNSKVVALRGYCHARLGKREHAREALATLEAVAKERYVPACAMGLVHAGLGDVRKAARYLHRAFEQRDVHLMFIQVDPKWDEALQDPAIADIVRACGFTLDTTLRPPGNLDAPWASGAAGP